MKFLILCLCIALSGCSLKWERIHKKPAKKTEVPSTALVPKVIPPPLIPPPITLNNQTDDNFDLFVKKLRIAVESAKVGNRLPLQEMMTVNFGYALNPVQEGVPFQYWDENDLWGELELVLKDRFAILDNYMVSPPDFVANPDQYGGHRAGIYRSQSGWKFAYFVSSPHAFRGSNIGLR